MKALLFCLILCIAVGAQTFSPSLTDAAKPAPMRAVAITPGLLKLFTDAQARTESARRVLEETPAYKNVVILQEQERTTLMGILAECGLKPSDECKPVLAKDGKLERFDCPIKEPEKKP